MKKLSLQLKSKPFTLQQAVEAGLNFYNLKKLVSDGQVEQFARGIYRVAAIDLTEEDQFKVATLRMGSPSAICLISALSFYHLTDTIPKKTWLMAPHSKKTSHRDIKLIRVRNPNWVIGVEKHNGYWITSIERTLVESLSNRARIGTQIGIEALRKAIKEKKTTLSKIVETATKLGLEHRILPYIEALS